MNFFVDVSADFGGIKSFAPIRKNQACKGLSRKIRVLRKNSQLEVVDEPSDLPD